MPLLNWISDIDLTNAVNKLLSVTQAAKAQAAAKMVANVMDPFSAIFQMSGFGMTYDEWYKSEEARQSQKTMQNFVGEFHQDILGFCKGWQNMGRGQIVDLVNTKRQIIAEVKNKHNTISGGDLFGLYDIFEGLVMPKTSTYKGFTAYHVSIIPGSPRRYDEEFTPSVKGTGARRPANKLIRTIDGASFYALATGSQYALKDLFTLLPSVIANLAPQQLTASDILKLEQLFKLAYG